MAKSLSLRPLQICLETWTPTFAYAPDRCLYIQAIHTLISTSLCRQIAPSTVTWYLELYLLVGLFPF